MRDSDEVPFKIVVAGGEQVGKSSVAFCLHEALGLSYSPQSPQAKLKMFDAYLNHHYLLLVPKETVQYPISKRFYKNAHILLACFNGDDPKSLDPLRRVVKEILDYSESPIIFLVNNQKKPILNNVLQDQSEKKLAAFLDVNGLSHHNVFNVNATKQDSFEPLIEEISRLTLKNRLLKSRLQKYISRIESHADKKSPNKINFAHGFLFLKSIRAKNREANYQLAKKLLEKLNQGENAAVLFPKAATLRKPFQPHWFFNHGIQSRELNSIIKPKPNNIDKRR